MLTNFPCLFFFSGGWHLTFLFVSPTFLKISKVAQLMLHSQNQASEVKNIMLYSTVTDIFRLTLLKILHL